MSAHAFIKVDKSAFLKFAAAREGRFEYVRGRIMMQQSGGSRRHSKIAKRFLVALDHQLDPARWETLGSDLAIDVGMTIRYPDVLVEPVEAELDGLATFQPALVVEVLSPSSEERDLVAKATEYLSLHSLQAYIVASQDEAACLVWLRGDDGDFSAEPVTVNGHGGVIRVPALAVELRLGDIYKGIC
jgi:Uma2 family endonuclease